jgi:hypothetical protein
MGLSLSEVDHADIGSRLLLPSVFSLVLPPLKKANKTIYSLIKGAAGFRNISMNKFYKAE